MRLSGLCCPGLGSQLGLWVQSWPGVCCRSVAAVPPPQAWLPALSGQKGQRSHPSWLPAQPL